MNSFQKILFLLSVIIAIYLGFSIYYGHVGILSDEFSSIFHLFLVTLALSLALISLVNFFKAILSIIFLLTILFLITDVIFDFNIGWGVHQLARYYFEDISAIHAFFVAFIVEILLFCILSIIGKTETETLNVEQSPNDSPSHNHLEQDLYVNKEAAEEESKEEESFEDTLSKIWGKRDFSKCPNCGNSSNIKEGIYKPCIAICETCGGVFCSKCCHKKTLTKSAICPFCEGETTRDIGRIV